MKIPRNRDWPFTIILTLMLMLGLALAVADPSCRYRGPPTLPSR